MRWGCLILLCALMGLSAKAEVLGEDDVSIAQLISGPAVPAVRPIPRDDYIPRARWDFRREGHLWTRTTMAALQGHGRPLIEMEPNDIRTWCPAYPENGPIHRAAFWNGFLSALAKHESTWKPRAVGGGGLWYGLTQILPSTARGYKCRVGTGAALKDGSANLSCAVRIMATTVKRDNAVARKTNGRLGGVAADWGPMVNAKKRKEMAAWTRRQTYCRLLSSVRPTPRPASLLPELPLAERLPEIRPAIRPANLALVTTSGSTQQE